MRLFELTNLRENAKDDAQIHAIADAIVDMLQKEYIGTDYSDAVYIDELYDLLPEDIYGHLMELYTLPIRLIKGTPDEYGMFRNQDFGSFSPGDYDEDGGTMELLDTGNIKDMKSVLSHEFRHALDFYRSNARAMKRQRAKIAKGTLLAVNRYPNDAYYKFDKDYEEYLRDPLEINARYNQVTRDIAEYVNSNSVKQIPSEELLMLVTRLFKRHNISQIFSTTEHPDLDVKQYRKLVIRAVKFAQQEISKQNYGSTNESWAQLFTTL